MRTSTGSRTYLIIIRTNTNNMTKKQIENKIEFLFKVVHNCGGDYLDYCEDSNTINAWCVKGRIWNDSRCRVISEPRTLEGEAMLIERVNDGSTWYPKDLVRTLLHHIRTHTDHKYIEDDDGGTLSIKQILTAFEEPTLTNHDI